MKLETPISLEAVQMFRGVVDLYYWKGIPCAREWPRRPKHPGTPAQKATWQAFSDMMAWKRFNPLSWQEAWNESPMPPNKSPEDVKRTTGLQLAYKNALTPAPDVLSLTVTPVPVSSWTSVAILVDAYTTFVPTDITFLAAGWNLIPVILTWYQSTQNCTRQDVYEYRYEPMLNLFLEPIAINWNAGTSTYTATFPFVTDNATIFPITTTPGTEGVMLGPMVQS